MGAIQFSPKNVRSLFTIPGYFRNFRSWIAVCVPCLAICPTASSERTIVGIHASLLSSTLSRDSAIFAERLAVSGMSSSMKMPQTITPTFPAVWIAWSGTQVIVALTEYGRSLVNEGRNTSRGGASMGTTTIFRALPEASTGGFIWALTHPDRNARISRIDAFRFMHAPRIVSAGMSSPKEYRFPWGIGRHMKRNVLRAPNIQGATFRKGRSSFNGPRVRRVSPGALPLGRRDGAFHLRRDPRDLPHAGEGRCRKDRRSDLPPVFPVRPRPHGRRIIGPHRRRGSVPWSPQMDRNRSDPDRLSSLRLPGVRSRSTDGTGQAIGCLLRSGASRRSLPQGIFPAPRDINGRQPRNPLGGGRADCRAGCVPPVRGSF